MIDATGVPFLKGDTVGYLIDGCPASYRIARTMYAHLASRYPEQKEYAIEQARWLNRVHLNRLISQSHYRANPEHWKNHMAYWVENLPRAERKKYHRMMASPNPYSACATELAKVIK